MAGLVCGMIDDRGDRHVRSWMTVFALATSVALAGCQPLPGPAPTAAAAPEVARGDAVAEARQCGRTLGIAVRCNLVRDDRDFAVVRYAVVQGVATRHAGSIGEAEVAELIDLATLDRITSIGRCALPPADLARVEAGVRQSISTCTGP